jgi:hypothetical protein
MGKVPAWVLGNKEILTEGFPALFECPVHHSVFFR